MKNIIKFSILIFVILGIVKIFSITPFNRFAGDDYSSAIMARLGIWQDIVATYNTSMGRFTAVMIETPFSSSLAYKGNISIYSLFTFLILLFSIFIFLKRFFSKEYGLSIIFLLTGIFFVSLYQLTPNKSESWYWLTGSVVYLWPIILSLYAFSFVSLNKLKKFDYLIPVIVSFFATSCNEAFGLFMILASSIALIYFWKDGQKRRLLISMLLASLFSFVIMSLAPGNDARKASYGSLPMSMFGSFLYSLSEGPKLYISIIFNNLYFLIPMLGIMVMVFIHFNDANKKIYKKLEYYLSRLFVAILVGLFLSVVFMLPSFVGLGRIQPDRSFISLVLVIILQILGVSYLISQIYLSKFSPNNYHLNILGSIFSVWVVFLSTIFTSSLPQDLYIARNYSQHFDLMINKFIEVSKSDNPDMEVKVGLPDGGLVAKLIDPVGVYSYKNLSLSQYYKIGKVITVEYVNIIYKE